jgi:methylated-DNA-[protein]-cysteine S-methyltransferase
MKFSQDCHKLLRKIPQGKVTTYKVIAEKLGTKGYRAVGQIVGANNDIPNAPCHRVVKTDGTIGGYALGVDKKIAILKTEGVEVQDGKITNFKEIFYKFDND